MTDWQARLDALIDEHHVPGATLGILADGEITAYGAGVLNRNTGVAVTPDSVFQIGSITKPFTATLVMQLVDEGAVQLDEPIRTYLPTFRVADPDVSEQVTIRHLLSHTSGIQGDSAADTGRGDDHLERFVEACAELTQTHPLGFTMSYCNTGYGILGRLVEVVTGTGFDQGLRERLFGPLGLTRTSTLPEEAILHRVAVGHIGDDLHVTPQWILPRKSTPSGLINSTVDDLLRFARLHLGEEPQLLSPGSIKAMQEPQVAIPDPYTVGEHWGLGWSLKTWGGRFVFGHGGNVIGQSAHLDIVPEAGVAVALLTNVGSSSALWRAIVDEVFGELAGVHMSPKLELPSEPPILDLSVYEGRFERLSVKAEIAREEDELVMTITSEGAVAKLLPEQAVQRVPLAPVREHVFLASVSGSTTPCVFFDVVDGVPRYFHLGARAMPRVG